MVTQEKLKAEMKAGQATQERLIAELKTKLKVPQAKLKPALRLSGLRQQPN